MFTYRTTNLLVPAHNENGFWNLYADEQNSFLQNRASFSVVQKLPVNTIINVFMLRTQILKALRSSVPKNLCLLVTKKCKGYSRSHYDTLFFVCF